MGNKRDHKNEVLEFFRFWNANAHNLWSGNEEEEEKTTAPNRFDQETNERVSEQETDGMRAYEENNEYTVGKI